jgi:hypothetical protein
MNYEKTIIDFLNKIIKPNHPEIERFAVTFDKRDGFCTIMVYVDGTDDEQEDEIYLDILVNFKHFFDIKRSKLYVDFQTI